MSGGCDSAIMAALSLETKKDLTSSHLILRIKNLVRWRKQKKLLDQLI